MNLNRTMSMGDYAIDRGLAEMDAEEARQIRVQKYINERSAEIHERRMQNITTEDFILALEIISTVRDQVATLQRMTYAEDTQLAFTLKAMVDAALLWNSMEIAVTEARAMESESPSRERH
ncbi:hypothetical protein [Caballeronia sp. AZ10_KS36]|uniref:hypothetical protein n=1 Tax=Caballeronia sp. AZ10_KS36 TaxID=2921757 RepID=UPI0020278EF8|nr:hypothetical protein [Caballeronia sp. AZ10_KS36]